MKQKNVLQILILCILVLAQFNSYSQIVVINEIVTDPQQDWSTTSFTTPPGGSGRSNDEWIELYIKAAGINLTGWTIELNDGSPVTGDLTSEREGAFAISNYITTGTGTFINTEVGDFLVLGNVTGGGLMSNNITIILKNSGGTMIDSVTLGGGAGEAPSGNADNIGDEAVFRKPNGTDTDTDDVDFSKGLASIGSINPTQVSWDGSSNTDWATAINWAVGSVPTTTDHIIIPSGLINYPTIATGTSVVVSSITIDSGASLIAEGTSTVTGNITYKRNLETANWYLVASPVAGESVLDFLNNHTLATGSGSSPTQNVGLATYDNTQTDANNRWQFYVDGDFNGVPDTPDMMNSNQGYSVKLATSNNISFTGTINTESVMNTLSQSSVGNNFNLIGNPYTSYINSTTFLDTQSTDLELTFWMWNGTSYNTRTTGISPNFMIAPGQGFFVEAKTENTVTFVESNQAHNTETETFQRTNLRPKIKLNLTDGTNNRATEIYYIEGTTTGFDSGYDGKEFSGISDPFTIYSHLVSNNNTTNYAIQSLPNSDYENIIIPIGINVASGKEIIFSAEVLNLPTGIKVFLEDRLTNTFTRLDEVNSEYRITLTESSEDIGRFYLHTTENILSVKNVILNSIRIFKNNSSILKIIGLPQGKASISIFNILGKEIITIMSNENNKEILLPNLTSGIYLVKVQTEKGAITKKIVL